MKILITTFTIIFAVLINLGCTNNQRKQEAILKQNKSLLSDTINQFSSDSIFNKPIKVAINKKDRVANNRLFGSPFGKIEGASILSVDDDKNKGHGISNFIQSILSLPAGKYNIINDQIIPE